MFRTFFFAILLITLLVNIIFLFATKDKPPDLVGSTTLVSITSGPGQWFGPPPPPPSTLTSLGGAADADQRHRVGQRRLFLRSNDFYDYSQALNETGGSLVFELANENKPTSKVQPAGDNGAGGSLQTTTTTAAAAAADHSSVQVLATRLKQQRLKAGELAKRKEQAADDKFVAITTFAYDNYNTNQPSDTSASSEIQSSSSSGKRPNSTSTPIPNPKAARDVGDNEIGNSAAANSDDEGKGKQFGQLNGDELQGKQAHKRRWFRLRVKSSKSHVLVALNDSIIYQSGSSPEFASSDLEDDDHDDNDAEQQQQQETENKLLGEKEETPSRRQERWQKRRRRRRRIRRTRGHNKDANQQNSLETGELERGIHVLVLNQFDASIMSRRRFDTYSPQQDDELALFLGQIQPGRLLVFAVRDEASFKMAPRSPARKLLTRLGSRHIRSLGWRDMWALVTVKRQVDLLETNTQIGEPSRAAAAVAAAWRQSGSSTTNLNKQIGANLAEGISHSESFARWGQAVEIEAQFELLEESTATSTSIGSTNTRPESCFNSSQEQRRRQFCSRVEGYGRVCDCLHPAKINFQNETKPLVSGSQRLEQVPIVVIASNRPYYLFRMLNSLLRARGIKPEMVTVFIDGFYEEPAEVCKLFNLRYIQHQPTGSRSARISSHYKTSLTLTFQQLFPKAQHAIIFEEDLDIAPDALDYFDQTLPVLERDSSLYCVSAWNDQGYEQSVGNLKQVYRIETMPGLGWMLSRQLFERELQPAWPAASQQHDWDMWIRTGPIRRGRECLIPDVSRTFHFGSTGTNINAYFQRQYFSKHAFSANYLNLDDDDDNFKISTNLSPGHFTGHFDSLDKLDEFKYDAELERIIRNDDEQTSLLLRWRQDSFNKNANSTGQAKLQRQYLCSLANQTHSLNGGGNNNVDLLRDNLGKKLLDDQNDDQKDDDGKSRVKTIVIFIRMIERADFANWLQLAKCWHLWDLDARGQHKSTWRLYLGGRPALIVGHPASPLSRFKPPDLKPFDLRTAIE